MRPLWRRTPHILLLFFWLQFPKTEARFRRHSRVFDELPHCSSQNVMEGEIRSYDDFKDRTKILSATQLQMTLRDTACLTMKASNHSMRTILHSIEFLRLEQHHPVIATYNFGIPKVRASCVCDCPGADTHCVLDEYNYKNCTSGAVCYRTYHPHQNGIGCLGNKNSEVCCKVSIDPYMDWQYTAVQIGQPDTILVLRYRIFEQSRGGRWKKAEDGENDKTIRVSMNKGAERIELSRHLVEISVAGSRPAREVVPGVYFVRDGTDELRGGVALNRVDESTLDKLGWFRREESGKWDIRKGTMLLKEALHLNIQDCKQQNYTWSLNAEQYVDASKNRGYYLGNPLTDDPWINTATYSGRVVRVDHAEGTAVTMTLATSQKPSVLRHPSQFLSFDGMIKLDRDSNRYLNLTFQEAKGTMIGKIFRLEGERDEEMTFSVQTDSTMLRDRVFIITVPSEIDDRRWVCLHPAGDANGKQCKWLEYNATAPARYNVPHPWQSAQGDCRGCNERSIEAVWAAMDPRAWFDGINSSTELFTMLLEVGIGIALVIALIFLVTKVLCPLCRCMLFIAKPSKIGSK
ncbi:unnamed protein product, partial [Mesorhabditis spiculigera]